MSDSQPPSKDRKQLSKDPQNKMNKCLSTKDRLRYHSFVLDCQRHVFYSQSSSSISSPSPSKTPKHAKNLQNDGDELQLNEDENRKTKNMLPIAIVPSNKRHNLKPIFPKPSKSSRQN